ncbi:MAG TPA: hypothetical protein VLH58_01575 [Candidatus Methylomirabilis sp.]|nr:hypothetical protein [Candidatus Methylomirabilis sp.]HSC70011.1 hypothetical protein [Candidatus Methylomirabilis sp.]
MNRASAGKGRRFAFLLGEHMLEALVAATAGAPLGWRSDSPKNS